ncbi:penicillin-binding protein [Bacteroides sp. 1_1_14]|nr:penicillin-binding protein [Bacteroides sp. 1_1_14]
MLNRILSTFAANNLLKAKDEKEQQKKYSSSINRRRLVYLPYQYLFEPQYASAKHN